jgi:gamma-glutamyltranspeptidase
MNYIKTFEGYNRFKEAYIKDTNAKIGDILDESTIYHYVQHIHDREKDFYDGDLGERIEKLSFIN